MQTSKLYIRRIVSLVILLAMVFFVFKSVGDILSPVSYQEYFDRDLESIKQENKDVDIMFVGASRVYMTFIPAVFEKKMNKNCVIVAGTAEQPICGTYYVIKDYVERFHPKHIVIGVTYSTLMNEPHWFGKAIVYDRLSLKNKLLFAVNCFDDDKLVLLKAVRYRNNILNLKAITEEKKELEERGCNPYSPTEEYYADKGFIHTYHSYATGNMPMSENYRYSNDMILTENLMYLENCVDFCQEQGIKVSLVTGPMSLMQTYLIEGYQEAVDFYCEFAESKGISYYNLNYLKSREEYLTDDTIRDHSHVNAKGAKIASEMYADILIKEQEGEDVSCFFYDDLDDLKKDVHRILSVGADISYTEAGKQDMAVTAKITLKSVHNENIVPYYRVEVKYAEGEYEVVSDWSTEDRVEIQLPANTGYEIKIRAKTGIEGDGEAYQIYTY